MFVSQIRNWQNNKFTLHTTPIPLFTPSRTLISTLSSPYYEPSVWRVRPLQNLGIVIGAQEGWQTQKLKNQRSKNVKSSRYDQRYPLHLWRAGQPPETIIDDFLAVKCSMRRWNHFWTFFFRRSAYGTRFWRKSEIGLQKPDASW